MNFLIAMTARACFTASHSRGPMRRGPLRVSGLSWRGEWLIITPHDHKRSTGLAGKAMMIARALPPAGRGPGQHYTFCRQLPADFPLRCVLCPVDGRARLRISSGRIGMRIRMIPPPAVPLPWLHPMPDPATEVLIMARQTAWPGAVLPKAGAMAAGAP